VLDKLTRVWIVKRLQVHLDLGNGALDWIAKRLHVHLGGDVFTLYGLVDSAFAPLVQSLFVMAILWLVMYWMYRRKIFLKI
jgi:predicted acyltransferase